MSTLNKHGTKERIIAVTGATGQIGKVLVASLLKKGLGVRAIGRDPQKLAALKSLGATPVSAESTDAASLTTAFRGADAVFSLVPPSYGAEDFGVYQDEAGRAIAEAIRASDVKKVVNLSSVGAHLDSGTGPIKGLHRHEKRLNELTGVDVLHLRPSYFMQNFLWSLPLIKEHGIISGAIRPDIAMEMISTDDIGERAAEILHRLDFTGKQVLEIAGPRPVTMTEATEILSREVGRPLKYIPISYEEETQALTGAGMRPSIVSLLVEMHRGFNEARIVSTQELTSTHRERTGLDRFATELARLTH